MDSQDICQSVMANFFQRATAGQFELETPDALLKLLATMIRNRVTDKARHFQTARVDVRRNSATDSALRGVPDSVCTPSLIIGRQEILQQIRSLLSEEEHQLVELRNQGISWAEIAVQLGGSPEKLRKRMARALERIAGQLNNNEDSDDESRLSAFPSTSLKVTAPGRLSTVVNPQFRRTGSRRCVCEASRSPIWA